MQETNHKNITWIFEDQGNLNGHLHILTKKLFMAPFPGHCELAQHTYSTAAASFECQKENSAQKTCQT